MIFPQTFAKLQNFTSSIRKNKSQENAENDENNTEKSSSRNKTSKERAIDKLQKLGNENDGVEKEGENEDKVEFNAYSGQVLEGASDDEEVGDDWHTGKLKFRRHITDKLRVGGDGRKLDDYVVIDPRSAQ